MQYYLCTVHGARDNVPYYANFVIEGHPIAYIKDHPGEALIYAIEISEKQFKDWINTEH